MMRTKQKYFLYGILAVIIAVFISGCITQEQEPKLNTKLSSDQLKITVNEGYAWLNLMPGDSRTKHISIPIEIENTAGFDLNKLHIYKAEVIKNKNIVGDFKPTFQISEDCSGKLDNEKFVDGINILNGCKLKFTIRAWRSSDNLPDFEGTIKVRFRFISNDYYTDIYETNEMTISKAY